MLLLRVAPHFGGVFTGFFKIVKFPFTQEHEGSSSTRKPRRVVQLQINMRPFILSLFLVCLLACVSGVFAESSEATGLLVGAFQNSGNNPKLFQTGKAEFDLFQTNEENQAMKRALEQAQASQRADIEQKFSADPQEMKKRLDVLQKQFATAVKGQAGRQEHLSILFSGTDNSLSQDRPENCKRRVDSRLFLRKPDNSGQEKPLERRFIFTGVLNQKNSLLNVELVPSSRKVEITSGFHNRYEFQLFGRMWDVGGAEIAEIFRKKMDGKTFSLPPDFASFFEEELKRLGLTCEVINEVEYDGTAKAKVVVVKNGQKILEQYHIDPSRGYICPYIKVVERSGWISVECIAKDFFPVGKNRLYYPSEYTYTTETELTGKSVEIYKLVKGTLEFNQRVSDKEFANDVPEGIMVLDSRGDGTQEGMPIPRPSSTPTVYRSVAPGTLSLSTDYSNLSKLPWLVREGEEYIPPSGGVSGWVRWVFMGIGIVMILIALYLMWRKRVR